MNFDATAKRVHLNTYGCSSGVLKVMKAPFFKAKHTVMQIKVLQLKIEFVCRTTSQP